MALRGFLLVGAAGVGILMASDGFQSITELLPSDPNDESPSCVPAGCDVADM